MAFLSEKMRRLYRDSVVSAGFGLLVFVIAVLFTYADDWSVQHHRPDWLVFGFRGLSILFFVTDSIAITCVCFKVMFESVREVFRP